jgi:hypothetical protein
MSDRHHRSKYTQDLLDDIQREARRELFICLAIVAGVGGLLAGLVQLL